MSSLQLKPLWMVAFPICVSSLFLCYAIPLFGGKTVETIAPSTLRRETRQEVRIVKWLNPDTGKEQDVEVKIDVPYVISEVGFRTVKRHYPISLKSIVVLVTVILVAVITLLSVVLTIFQVYTIERKTKKEAPKHLRERYNKQMVFLWGIVTGFLSANESADVLIPMTDTGNFNSDGDAPMDGVAAPPANDFEDHGPKSHEILRP